MKFNYNFFREDKIYFDKNLLIVGLHYPKIR